MEPFENYYNKEVESREGDLLAAVNKLIEDKGNANHEEYDWGASYEEE